MTNKTFGPGDIVIESDQIPQGVYRVVSGHLELSWTWPSWTPIAIAPGSFLAIVEAVLNIKTLYRVKALEESEIQIMESENVIFPNSEDVSRQALCSLGALYERILFQRFIGVEMEDPELMYQAFDSFVKVGNETLAIEAYSRFIMEYPNSEFIDQMLKLIQALFSDSADDATIPEDDQTAFDYILTKINSSNPNENLLLLKTFEKKFPDSGLLDRILSMIIDEYDKLGDEYQLNHYTRKLVFKSVHSNFAKDALYYLIHLQRRNGKPEWYENVLRFLLVYDDKEQVSMLKKYISPEQD